MSLLPAYFGARRKREEDDLAPLREPDDLAPLREPDNDSREDIFNLIPPRAPDRPTRFENPEPETIPETPEPPETSRDARAVGAMDLSRMSIDNDGRLYWDGKPVEVRRRIMMSRAQIVGASLIGVFVVIGAVGAAMQGSAAAHDWACRIGWTSAYCTPSAPAPTLPARTDIPA